MDRIHRVETFVRYSLQKEHQAQEEKWNQGLESRFKYKVGDWVWALRVPRPNKDTLDTWWVGPGRIVARVGSHSYKVEIKDKQTMDYHSTFLKPYNDDPVGHTGVPLFWHQHHTYSTLLTNEGDQVARILGHKIERGTYLFWVEWKGSKEQEWVSSNAFFHGYSTIFMEYLQKTGLSGVIQEVLMDTRRGIEGGT